MEIDFIKVGCGQVYPVRNPSPDRRGRYIKRISNYARGLLNMTKNDLRQELVKKNIPADLYSLNGGLPNEAYCLNPGANDWEVYYSERGQKTGLKIFNTEAEACDYFYQSLLQVLGDMGILQKYSKPDRGSKISSGTSLMWIECDGGPHLVLEKRIAHYDWACEIEDYVGVEIDCLI